ncbi:MAG: hypothetical protein MI922_27605, partial [Bacteroidales bacterium]|nr:hypothetical protein [Bacteroidales bacterium]
MAINTLTASSLLEREIALKEICSELNQFVDLKNVLYTIISRLQSLTNIEAVGVRLKNGYDYPYFVYDGFDKKFIQKENSLCTKDSKGCPIPKVGGEGFKLECMCGSVINGQFDSSVDFFTDKGSFWTNGT